MTCGAEHAELTAVVPALVRLGDLHTPKLDHVRHRLMPNVKSPAVDAEESDGTIFVMPGSLIVHDTTFVGSVGVSTFDRTVPAFQLAVAQSQPKAAALWMLQEGSAVPSSLVVRPDHVNPRHVLWAPRGRMTLADYKAALASVGRDKDGAYSGWKRWDNPLEMLEQLPLSGAEKAELVADAESLITKARERPTTPVQFLGKAILAFALAGGQLGESGLGLDFLSAMARLGAAIFDDTAGEGVSSHVSTVCRRFAESAASGAITGPAVPRKSSRLDVDVVLTVVDCTMYRLRLRQEEGRFIYRALVAARRDVMAAAMDLPEEAGDEFDNGVEDMRQQCELGRQAAISLGFTRMAWYR